MGSQGRELGWARCLVRNPRAGAVPTKWTAVVTDRAAAKAAHDPACYRLPAFRGKGPVAAAVSPRYAVPQRAAFATYGDGEGVATAAPGRLRRQ
jgi:hypothetical protein